MTDDAGALYRRGQELAALRRLDEAAAVLDEAAARSDDPDLSARIIGTQAFLLTQTGRSEEGERRCLAALADDRLTPHTRGVVQGQLGSVLVNQGRLDEGVMWIGRAIETIPDDPLAVANLRINRSLVHMQRRDLAASAADIEATLDVFAEYGSPTDAAEARHNLGYVALLGGDLVRAMREMAAARPVLDGVSAATSAIGDVDRAEVLRDAGLVTEAERLLGAAARAFGEARMPQARGEAELQLAVSLLRHDPRRAEGVARTAARRFTALGSHSWAARADGIRLRARMADAPADLLDAGSSRGGRIDDAQVDRVAQRLSRGGFRNEASALRLTRELRRARTARPAGRLPAPGPDATLDVRLLRHEVRAARARSDREAQRHAAAGLDELSARRTAFGSLDLQASVTMYGHDILLAGIDAAVRGGEVADVFAWSERARLLSQELTPLRPPPDPQSAADLAELRMLRADLTGTEWMTDPRVVGLGARLRERQWAGTGPADQTPRRELADVQRHLDADTAVVSFVLGSAGLRAVVVTDTEARIVPLPGWPEARAILPGLRADLDMAASIRVGPMAAVVARSLAGRLDALADALLADPLAIVGARRVVLTVPGALSGVPWAMLPGMRGRAFTVAGSVSRWVTSSRRAVVRAGFAAGPRVARAASEVSAASAAWGSPVQLTGETATVDAVSTLAGTVDVLHVAAHGRHASDNPLFSGIELADGVLFGYDVDRIAPVPRVVILSACEVGRSAVRWGEESVGMTRAWLHAGADCVIAAPVMVRDEDAATLLAALHTGLAGGSSPSRALAEARQRTGIDAPFQCYGSGF